MSLLHIISTTSYCRQRPFVVSDPCQGLTLILLSLLHPFQPGLVHCAPRKPNPTQQQKTCGKRCTFLRRKEALTQTHPPQNQRPPPPWLHTGEKSCRPKPLHPRINPGGRFLRYGQYTEASLLQHFYNCVRQCYSNVHTSIATSRRRIIAWRRQGTLLLFFFGSDQDELA